MLCFNYISSCLADTLQTSISLVIDADWTPLCLKTTTLAYTFFLVCFLLHSPVVINNNED